MQSGKNTRPRNFEEYISVFPKEKREKLEKLRITIKKAAPKADEVISYNMPAFKYFGMLVYFAAFQNHYSLFPASRETFKQFRKELSIYELSKGTIRFKFDEPVPAGLVTKIVKFRVKENLEKSLLKTRKTKIN